MKTNRERAENFATIFADRLEGHGTHIPVWARQGLFNTALELMDKAEKRGKRNEKQWWRERWQNRNKDIIQHIEQQCVPPQPEPQRYTREEAEKLASALRDASNITWQTCSQFSVKMELIAWRAVIDAITGQPKPAPQFDMEQGTFMGRPFSYWIELDILIRTQCGNLCQTLSERPAPQFDAKKVKEQIAILRVEAFHVGKLHEKVCGATKDEGYLSRYATLDAIHGKLLAALHIE